MDPSAHEKSKAAYSAQSCRCNIFPPRQALPEGSRSASSRRHLVRRKAEATTTAESEGWVEHCDCNDSMRCFVDECRPIHRCGSPTSEDSMTAAMHPALAHVYLSKDEQLSPAKRAWTEDVAVAADLSKPTRAFSDKTDPDVIVQTCRSILPSWQSLPRSKIVVSKILSGLTNQLFSVQVKGGQADPARVLFRIYGKDVGELYDSAFEVEVFKTLTDKGIAPQLLGEFSGGRIEEWIDGVPLAVEDASRETVLVAVAKLLGTFHKLHRDEDFPKEWANTPTSITCLRKWSDRARTIIAKCHADASSASPFGSLSLDEMLMEVPLLNQRVLPSDRPPTLATSVVFCHNDMQENNIMRVRGGDVLRLIDFEYSGYNYAGFDFANFFSECTIDYTHPVYPFYKIDKANYPSERARVACAAAYLSEILGRPVPTSYLELIHPFLEGVERLVLVSHLLWGFWSIIRAPQAPTFEEFDYVMHAKDRFDYYKSHLAALVDRGLVPDFATTCPPRDPGFSSASFACDESCMDRAMEASCCPGTEEEEEQDDHEVRDVRAAWLA